MVARETYVKTSAGWEQIATTITAIPQGLVPIVPTSVVNGSFTGDGVVSFSSVGSVSLNGVFTSAFTNYLVNWNFISGTSDAAVTIRFRANGTDDSATSYASSYQEALSGGGFVASGGTVSAIRVGRMSTTGGGGEIKVFAPQLSTTRSRAVAQSQDSTHFAQGGGTWNANKTHDGFTLILSGITGTGTLQVFGYSKGGLTQPQTIQPFSSSAGSATISVSNSTFGSTTVTFPVGRFTQAPIVSATKANNVSGGGGYVTAVASVTSTGMTINSFDNAPDRVNRTLSFPVHWLATQMTSSSGGG
jgi:hypothetical protein